jgi:hypothetical protein
MHEVMPKNTKTKHRSGSQQQLQPNWLGATSIKGLRYWTFSWLREEVLIHPADKAIRVQGLLREVLISTREKLDPAKPGIDSWSSRIPRFFQEAWRILWEDVIPQAPPFPLVVMYWGQHSRLLHRRNLGHAESARLLQKESRDSSKFLGCSPLKLNFYLG